LALTEEPEVLKVQSALIDQHFTESVMPQKDQPQNRPRSPKHAPDPATSYERIKREKKPQLNKGGTSGQETDPDDMNIGQDNAQVPDRQINAQDEPTEGTAPAQPLNQIDLSKPGRKRR
jgi:hypothetical protein